MYDVNRLFCLSQLEDGAHLFGQRLAERLVVLGLHVAAVHAGLGDAVGVIMEAAGAVGDLLEIVGVVDAFLPSFAPHGRFGNVCYRGWRDDQNLRACLGQRVMALDRLNEREHASRRVVGRDSILFLEIIASQHDDQDVDRRMGFQHRNDRPHAVLVDAFDRVVEHGGPPTQAFLDNPGFGSQIASDYVGIALVRRNTVRRLGNVGEGRAAPGVGVAEADDGIHSLSPRMRRRHRRTGCNGGLCCYIDHTCSKKQRHCGSQRAHDPASRENDLSVYRRPDPIPRPRQEPQQAPSPLQPVRQEPDDLNHLIARKIFAAISSGHFAEGSILPNEFALGETLGVSRTALREAIKGLSSKGMLETRRRRGTRVTDRSQWTLIDGEVINWSRKDGDNRISEELWQGLTLVMPEVARLAAANPLRVRLGQAQGAQRALAVAALLTEIARLSGNRFLTSLASISLISLARDDRPFLDKRFGTISEKAIEILRSAVISGDASGAALAIGAFFETSDQPADAEAASC